MRRKGFTIIELLIVLAIIGILAAIAIPGYIGWRYRSLAEKIAEGRQLTNEELEQYKNAKESVDRFLVNIRKKQKEEADEKRVEEYEKKQEAKKNAPEPSVAKPTPAPPPTQQITANAPTVLATETKMSVSEAIKQPIPAIPPIQ